MIWFLLTVAVLALDALNLIVRGQQPHRCLNCNRPLQQQLDDTGFCRHGYGCRTDSVHPDELSG